MKRHPDIEPGSDEAWATWRAELAPLSRARTTPPDWVVEGLLPPGLTLMVGPPKTFKSTAALAVAAAVTHGLVIPGSNGKRVKKKGTVVYIAYEQSSGKLRHILESRIIRRSLKPSETGLCMVKAPWEWQIDEPQGEMRSIERLVRELAPAITIIDPLVLAHSQDENDPRMVRPLVPIREAALELGVSVLIVHHANKRAGDGKQDGATGMDFDRIRGTSALWGMADGGHMMKKIGPSAVGFNSDFKDFESRQWTWRVPK